MVIGYYEKKEWENLKKNLVEFLEIKDETIRMKKKLLDKLNSRLNKN